MKKLFAIVGMLILVALGGRAYWAYQKMKFTEQREATPTLLSTDSATSQSQFTPPQYKSGAVKNGTGCDIKDAMGQTTHLKSEECARYQRAEQNFFESFDKGTQARSHELKEITGNTPIIVPFDWKPYTNSRFGFSMQLPPNYQVTADSYGNPLSYGNMLLYGVKGALESELSVKQYLHKGKSFCSEFGTIPEDIFLKEEKIDDKNTSPIFVNGLQWKIFYHGTKYTYVYQAYLKRNDVDIWYFFTLNAAEDSDLLFRQFLAGISLSPVANIGVLEKMCK